MNEHYPSVPECTSTKHTKYTLTEHINVVNLFNRKLSRHSLSLLNKSLSFIPIQSGPKYNGSLIDDLHKLSNTYVNKYKYQISNRAERILKSTLKAIEFDLNHCYPSTVPPNIEERNIL